MVEKQAAPSASRPYHKYVFDVEKRAFVGRFEEMYQAEDAENFSSWYQEDLTHPIKRLVPLLLAEYSYRRVLDVGCGTGSLTHLLRRRDAEVVGVDVSPTALKKASARYPHVRFEVADAQDLPWDALGQFDLVVALEVLSYLEGWRTFVRDAAARSERLLLSLYLPPDPIGFVKSFDELRDAFSEHFEVESEVLWNRETLVLVGRSRSLGRGSASSGAG